MSVSIDDVEHIARLARLGLREEEKEPLRSELESILSYVEKLRSVDTSEIPPTTGVRADTPGLREDAITNSERAEEMVAGAPDRDDTFLRVPRIIE